MDHTLNTAAIEAGLRNPALTFAKAYENVRALIQAERNLPAGFTDDDVEVAASRTIEALDVLAAVPAPSASDAFAKVAAICTILEAHSIDHLNAALAELGALLASPPAPSSDATLVDAWEKWKTASLAVEMVGREDGDPVVATHYAERDLAEQAILNSQATSGPGLLVKQRFALECTMPDAWAMRALYDGDDATLIARKAELDLEGRLIVDTIEGLLTAERSALPTSLTPFRLAHQRYLATRQAFEATPCDNDSPAYKEAERVFLEAAEAADATPVSSWAEFSDAFLLVCDDGESGITEKNQAKLVADALRLRQQGIA
jgi:hypothetical protein